MRHHVPGRIALILGLCALVLSSASAALAEPVTQVQKLQELADRFERQLQARRTQDYYDLLAGTDPAQAALNADPDIQLMFIGERGKPFFFSRMPDSFALAMMLWIRACPYWM